MICDTRTVVLEVHQKEDEATVEVIGQTHRNTLRNYGNSLLIKAQAWSFTDITQKVHKVLSTAGEGSFAALAIDIKLGETKIIEVCAYLQDWVITSGIIVALGTVISNQYNLKAAGQFLPIGGHAAIDWVQFDAVSNTTVASEKLTAEDSTITSSNSTVL